MMALKHVKSFGGLVAVTLIAGLITSGCGVMTYGVDDRPYVGDKYLDARDPSNLSTTTIESADLQSACNQAVGRILAEPRLANPDMPPVYLVNEEDFHLIADNDFNVPALVDLLRNELVNAADSRVRVLAKTVHDPVAADFALGGRITDVRADGKNRQETYTQIALEVISLKTDEVVFSDLYSIKKAAKSSRSVF